MPVKNAAPFLDACLNSIVVQEGVKWELIAINDGSEDDSLEILTEFAQRFDNVQVANNTGSGIIAALRAAYALSMGDFVHRMDADDIMAPNKLKMMQDLWESGCIVTGKVKYFSEDECVGQGFKNYENWINTLMDSEDIWQDVYKECPLPSPAWFMHRTDFSALGAFDSELLPEDYDLCFRVYKSGLKVKSVKQVIHYWRDSINRTSRKMPLYFPMAYYPLKVYYFLEIDRHPPKPLLLWGAGKKGKLLAKLLLQKEETFVWATENRNKIGVNIYGQIILGIADLNLLNYQIILAIASPQDSLDVQKQLNNYNLANAKDYFWFC